MENVLMSYFNIKPKSFCKFLCFFKLVLIKKFVQSGGSRERNSVQSTALKAVCLPEEKYNLKYSIKV